MDVDLLRPGTVPISPDTILWFEFLLNPSLLLEHLSKSSPDPSPIDLIIKFMTINSEQRETEIKAIELESNEVKQNPSPKWSHKNLALKILSLKVVAYLKWDLDIIETKLPLPMQISLLQDLFFITTDVFVEFPMIPEFPLDSLTDQGLFTLVLYHRWHLRAIVCKSLNNRQTKSPFIHISFVRHGGWACSFASESFILSDGLYEFYHTLSLFFLSKKHIGMYEKELYRESAVKQTNFSSRMIDRVVKSDAPGIQESTFVPSTITEDIMRKLETYVPNSISVLNDVLELEDIKPKVLSFETLVMLTEDSTECKQNWENMRTISVDEFKCQIHYDLAVFHLMREDYPNAKRHFSCAKELFGKLNTSDSPIYCSVKAEYLNGYCLACEIPVENMKPDLIQQMHASIKDQYTNIVQVLQADNVTREIPQVYRDNLELDIQGGMVNRKIIVARDLFTRIQCLNLVRKVLDNAVLLGDYVAELKNAGTKGINILFWAFDNVMEKLSDADKRRVAQFLLYLVLSGDIDGLATKILDDPKYRALFEERELSEIKLEAEANDNDIPELLTDNNWGIQSVTYTKSSRVDVGELQQQIILSYNPHEIQELLIRLASSLKKPLWRVNNCWELPIPLQSVAMSLPRGFLQDYSYVLLAKSRELVSSKDFVGAKDMLNVLEQEAQQHNQSGNTLIFKLCKLVAWEALLAEILHCLHVWPANNVCDTQALVEKCKQCLGALQATDQVIPRQEIIEYCTIFLLNMAEWDYLMNLEKRWSYLELAAAISNVCQDIVKYKGSRKFSREMWDMVLAVFTSNNQQSQKRSSSGSSGASSSRDAAAAVSGALSRLREPTALTVATSLLARLHNVLRDESSLELHTQYLNLWPASVPNSNSYNTRTIGESLFQLLTQALKFYPSNISWLKLMADLNFVLGYHESAMKYYLEATMVASDLFTQPVPRTQIDDMVYRRMIKCCAQLQCYTQAAVLCQFLEEVDYALAFKMTASDQKNCAAADAMDAYYHCIWDTTILEYLIHLHTKRGEHHRKQLAIKVIGLLELNSNNNEEIQREAANIRKAKFLRALAKQYVY